MGINKKKSKHNMPLMAKRFAVCVALASLGVASANAGGFSVREQSTTGLGAAFAGVAAGNTPSSMYWNGATLSNTKGFVTESSYNGIIADSTIYSPADGNVDIGTFGFVGASYLAYQINDRLYVGLGLNAPFGFATKASNKNFSGGVRGTESDVLSFNANPTIAYKLTPSFTVSVGAQVEYMKIRLEQNLPIPGFQGLLKGSDIAMGFTAGVMYQPSDWTSIGLGYRSSVNHTLGGTLSSVPVPFLNQSVTANLKTPDLVTLSARQKVTDKVTLMGTVEWSNWSNLQELRVINASTGAVVGTPVDFSWKDGWFYSVGAEYNWSDALTLRTGLAYEKTPVPDSTRSVRLPDADRLWLSMGASYKWSEATELSFGYSHIFVDNSNINLAAVPTSGLPAYAASVETSLDIISVGIKTKW